MGSISHKPPAIIVFVNIGNLLIGRSAPLDRFNYLDIAGHLAIIIFDKMDFDGLSLRKREIKPLFKHMSLTSNNYYPYTLPLKKDT